MAPLIFKEGQNHYQSTICNAEQLLPNLVDGMASAKPFTVYAEIPNSFTSYAEGYRKVTYRNLANAVNGVAWHLEKELGKGDHDRFLAYFGPNDIGYIVVVLGACKAGYATLLPSPRLTRKNQRSLLDATNCETILTLSEPYAPAVRDLLSDLADQLRIVHIPTIFELLDRTFEHFPYPQAYADVKHHPLVVFHTSGTIGAPKPLIYTHNTASSFVRELRQRPPEGHFNTVSSVQSNRVFAAFPFFHAGAVALALFDGILSQTRIVTGLAGVPPSAASIVEGLQHVNVDAMCLPAPVVDHLSQNEEWFSFVVGQVHVIAYSGADIRDECGAAFIAAGVRIITLFGSSEAFTTPCVRRWNDELADTWHHIQPHPYVNTRFEPVGDLFEMVLDRNSEPERCQPVFTLYPQLDKWHTKDLFSPHPQDPRLWRFRGRVDDMIAGATGEVCNPVAFERQVCGADGFEAALMVGTGRWRKALLVEAADPDMSSPGKCEAFVESIWPSIVLANQHMSCTSQVAKSHVLLTSPGLPMQRTAKGNVQRTPTLRLYKQQFDELYRMNEDGADLCEDFVPVHLNM